MNRRLFGTDGIRGLAGIEPLTPETVMALGRAVGRGFRNGDDRPRVVIGRDTRLSGEMLEAAFCAGLGASGADALRLGILPTPAVAYLTTKMGTCGGAMISASHNPFGDNGIKLFGADGFKLTDEMEIEVERLLAEGVPTPVTGSDIGRAAPLSGADDMYLEHLRGAAGPELDLRGCSIVIDSGHGAAYRLGPTLFESFGARVHRLGDRPDGCNINDGVGSLHLGPLQRAVTEHQAQLGIALDGDADRAIFVDEKGEVHNGDDALALFAEMLLQEGRLPDRTVVATQMSNLGLERFLETLGIRLLRTAVGDRYVVEAMRQGRHPLGGEQSGHIIFLDYASTGDGLLTALQVCRAMQTRQRPLSELLCKFDVLPQILINVRLKRFKPLESLPSVVRSIAVAEKSLGRHGRVFVRFSGTEPLARVMMEGAALEQLETLGQGIAEEIRRHLG